MMRYQHVRCDDKMLRRYCHAHKQISDRTLTIAVQHRNEDMLL